MSSGNNIEIKLLDADNSIDWDTFVNECAQGTFFHQYGWKEIIENSLGHKTYYYCALSDTGKIVGVLPIVYVNSILFGKSLSSVAFGSYGGALGESPRIIEQLEDVAVNLGRSLNVGSVEFRYKNSSGKDRPRKDLYERFIKQILPDEDQNMQAIRSKQRNIIRKGIKKGLEFSVDSCANFYPIYAESVRNLGTPVYPKSLFSTIADKFPNQVEILTAHLGDERISSALVYYFKDEVCPYYWGGRYRARELAANDFLAWNILCRAAKRGCKQFDFGRSKKNTGSRQWKINLGFEPEQLHYEYELIRDTEMPDINPLNPKFKVFVDAWKKLPLPVATLAGPIISKNLG